MLSEKMQAALNVQINEELSSAYIYLQMAAECDRLGLPGFVNWFKMQYTEELAHADRFSILYWNEMARYIWTPSPNRNWVKRHR